jgi:hypothetical protein
LKNWILALLSFRSTSATTGGNRVSDSNCSHLLSEPWKSCPNRGNLSVNGRRWHLCMQDDQKCKKITPLAAPDMGRLTLFITLKIFVFIRERPSSIK